MDDAHGFGVLGERGRGTANHLGVTDEVDILCGSLSKSLASTGGFVAGDKDLIEFLRTHSKQTIFSAAISASQAACAEAALDILKSEPEHLERLWTNTERYKGILHSLGLNTWEAPRQPSPSSSAKNSRHTVSGRNFSRKAYLQRFPFLPQCRRRKI